MFGAEGGAKDPRKGFDLIQDSLKNIANNKLNKKIELLIFGESKPKKPFDFGLPVHYAGILNDDLSLQLAYSAADVMLVPSRQDNLPNTGVEAQSCGLPVVAFNVGGLPDIVKHKQTGYLANAYDVVDFVKGISWVLDNKDTVELSKKARKHAVNQFSEDKIANDYIKFYTQVLENK